MFGATWAKWFGRGAAVLRPPVRQASPARFHGAMLPIRALQAQKNTVSLRRR